MEQSNLAKYFKALSNPQRLKLFLMIHRRFEKTNAGQGESCCQGFEKAFTAACSCLKLSRSTISHHFKELQSAGLITCQRIGQAFSCKVNEDAVRAIKEFTE